MATVVKNRDSNTWYIQFQFRGKRRKLYGFPSKKTASQTGERIETLKDALMLGSISREIKFWLDDVWKNNPELYRRLVDVGLTDEREECGTLGELADRFVNYPIAGRLPKKRTMRNRRVATNLLIHFLGNQPMGNLKTDARVIQKITSMRADSVTKEKANELYAFMQRTYQPTTWGRRIKHLKTMFELAVQFHWLEVNPFCHLRGTSAVNDKRKFFVTPEMAKKVLQACPDSRWRLIFTLGRWGGLRIPSELAFLRWSEIDWTAKKMLINIPKKTSRVEQERGNFATRWIPLFPEIDLALREYREEYDCEDEDFIFPDLDGTDSDGILLRKDLTGILRRAGLTPWPKLFMNLRSTRDTELQNSLPLYVVCSILGHDPQISLKHYTQITDETFLRLSSSDPTASNPFPLTNSGHHSGHFSGQ